MKNEGKKIEGKGKLIELGYAWYKSMAERHRMPEEIKASALEAIE